VADGTEEAGTSSAAAVRRDRADRGLHVARARAESEALQPAPSRQRRTVAVPEGWPSANELHSRPAPGEARLARELARAAPVPVLDEATWRARTEADRAAAEKDGPRRRGMERKRLRPGQDGERLRRPTRAPTRLTSPFASPPGAPSRRARPVSGTPSLYT
jgi:hypothetical protein